MAASLPKEPQRGQPIRGEWGRDVVRYLHYLTLRGGAGIRVNRTGPNITVSRARDRAGSSASGPKLWHFQPDEALTLTDPFKILEKVMTESVPAVIDALPVEETIGGVIDGVVGGLGWGSNPVDSFAAAIENLFDAAYDVLDTIQSEVDDAMNQPVSAALASYFANAEKSPKDGDVIYTEEIGMTYQVWKQHVSEETGETVPTENLVFRVPFTVGEGESQTTFVACSYVPFPDIAGFLKTIFKLVLDFFKKIVSSVISSLAGALANMVIAALAALRSALLSAIGAVQSALNDLIDTLGGAGNIFDPSDILDALQALTDRVDPLETAMDALETLVDEHETTLAAKVNVTVIDSAGLAQTITVLANPTGGTDLRQSQVFFNPSTKQKVTVDMLKWNHAAEDITIWKQVDYIHPDGRTWQMNVLTQETDGPVEQAESYEVEEIMMVEDNNDPGSRNFLTKEVPEE